MVAEINERLDPSGETVRALDLEEAQSKLEALALTRPDAVAVCCCTLTQITHEREIRHLLSNLMPDVYVVLSSEIWPEIFEYERASTTVASAYVGPVLAASANSWRNSRTLVSAPVYRSCSHRGRSSRHLVRSVVQFKPWSRAQRLAS